MESDKVKQIIKIIKQNPELNASKVLQKVKDEGIKIRRQDFFILFKENRNIVKIKDTSKNIPTHIRVRQLAKQKKSKSEIKSILKFEHRKINDKTADKAINIAEKVVKKKGNTQAIKKVIKKGNRKRIRKHKNIKFVGRRVAELNSNTYGVIELNQEIDSYDDGSPSKRHKTKILTFGLRGRGDIEKFHNSVIKADNQGNINALYYLNYYSNSGTKTSIDINSIRKQRKLKDYLEEEIEETEEKIKEVDLFKDLNQLRNGIDELKE